MWLVNNPANKQTQQIRETSPMPIQCRYTTCDAGTTPGQCVESTEQQPHRHHNKTRYTSTQRRYNADPALQTVGQHCTNTGRTLRACRDYHKPHTYKRYLHACWRYDYDALNQSCVNVGQPFVMLAHIQRGIKHYKVTQYWANVG